MQNLAFVCTALSVAAFIFALFGSGVTSLKRRGLIQSSGTRGLNLLYWLQPWLTAAVDVIDRISFLRPWLENLASRLRMRLIRAGRPGGLTPNEFAAFKVLLGVGTFLFLIGRFGIINLPIWGAISFCAYYWPTLWLNDQIKKQSRLILGELPDALDLLALMSNAGLDLGQAITHYLRDSQRTPLKALLEEVRAQMVLGRTRSEALEYLARKVDLPSITQTVSAFVQADRLGAPIGQTLTLQAIDLREERLQRAETHGQTASIKLLAPLLLFIMPCVGLILFGPMLIQFLTGQ